ncbi:MAG: hypothetical protein N2445_05770, partial [Acidobacteria bacterium]|nr:hypothetical protein [Acidobacteriota bacterium]
ILPMLCKIYNCLLNFEKLSTKEIEDLHKRILSFNADEKIFLKGLKSFESIISNDFSLKYLLSDCKMFPQFSERIFTAVSLSPPLCEYLKTIPETISVLLKEDFSKTDLINFAKTIKEKEIREIALEQKKIFVQSIA